MSDEPKPNENGGEWTMPKPVFRTSEGFTPKGPTRSLEPEDVDTLRTEDASDDEDEIDTLIPNVPDSKFEGDAPNDPVESPVNSVRAAPEKPKSGCARGALMIAGMVAIIALGLIAVGVYFLYVYTPAETSTF